MPNFNNILILDKDETIITTTPKYGEYITFPGTHAFLQQQINENRTCIVATLAGNAAEQQLTDNQIEHFITAYYGRETLDTKGNLYRSFFNRIFHLPDGTTYSLINQNKLSIQRLITSSHPYQNPYIKHPNSPALRKDLHIIRTNTESATRPTGVTNKQIMIGNTVDSICSATDPKTIVITVGTQGEWLTNQRIPQLLDTIFDSNQPNQHIFTELYNAGIKLPNHEVRCPPHHIHLFHNGRQIRIGENNYRLYITCGENDFVYQGVMVIDESPSV